MDRIYKILKHTETKSENQEDENVKKENHYFRIREEK